MMVVLMSRRPNPTSIWLCVLSALLSLAFAKNDSTPDDSHIEPLLFKPMRTKDRWKTLYVDIDGQLSNFKHESKPQIEISGTPNVSARAVKEAGVIIGKIIRHITSDLFLRLSHRVSVGVFTKEEKPTIFPEYRRYRKSNFYCEGSCSGRCKDTCNPDGRKWEELNGIGGERAVIVDDNILCSPDDPYLHKENILVHEFVHSIHLFALNASEKDKITRAYYEARRKKIWRLKSYAMSNEIEYFAEAATVFFGVNWYSSYYSGGMIRCGEGLCQTEDQGRENLKIKDPDVYNILSQIFTDNRPDRSSGLSICPLK